MTGLRLSGNQDGSWKLTPLKGRFLLCIFMFRFHVTFRGGIWDPNLSMEESRLQTRCAKLLKSHWESKGIPSPNATHPKKHDENNNPFIRPYRISLLGVACWFWGYPLDFPHHHWANTKVTACEIWSIRNSNLGRFSPFHGPHSCLRPGFLLE